MRHILEALIVELEKESPCIIASIVGSSGSAPRTSGARMLVKEDSSIAGSVGGGAVEGRCIAKAQKLFTTDETDFVQDFDLKPNDAADLGMVCGGAVCVLLQKAQVVDIKFFQELNRVYKNGEHPVLLTHLPYADNRASFSILDFEESHLKQKIAFELSQQKTKVPFMFSSLAGKIFVETLIHPGTVHLMGAGHVALATAKLAHFAHFEVVVADDREEFANAKRYPDAKEVKVLDKFENCCVKLGVDDYVVIVTRGHIHDRDVLAEALKTEAGYIGMIGSSRKIRAIYDSLLESGFCQQDLDRVNSPIGISIKADTPEEIAVSIVAELIQTRAGR